jgi:serine protease inhibitor
LHPAVEFCAIQGACGASALPANPSGGGELGDESPLIRDFDAISAAVSKAAGTEAAAATAVAMQMAGAAPGPPEEPQLLHVDHPFLFAIPDDANGVILFQGRIVDPR